MPAALAAKIVDQADGKPGSPSLSAEANHQIANHLALIAALIRLQAADAAKKQTVSGEDLRLALEEAGIRIDSVARLHRLVAEAQGGSVDLGDYLRALAEGAVS